jgi:hypothetical protein
MKDHFANVSKEELLEGLRRAGIIRVYRSRLMWILSGWWHKVRRRICESKEP